MAPKLLSHLAHVDKAAQLCSAKEAGDKDGAAVTVPLTDEARKLPEHIIASTDVRKLNRQTPYFRCPAWADLSPKAYHLHCTRDHVPLPALGLDRFAFYLFGKAAVCDYVLEHPSISSVHAALIFHRTQGCFVLVDLGSTNGVRLNGQRIGPQRPMPVSVGATIQFGYSTRVYELRSGAAPSSKRLREERDARAATPDTDTSTSTAVRADVRVEGKEGDAVVPSIAASLREAASETVKDAARAPPVEQPAVSDEAAPTRRKAHLFQLVVKHKDVDHPVSRGRQKGEVITRSREDAFDIARFVLRAHARDQAATTPTSAFVPWSVEDFVAAVQQYCEGSSAKKKGDLGVVEEGTFAEAFDKVAFALRRGEVSEPFETALGVHLLYRCD